MRMRPVLVDSLRRIRPMYFFGGFFSITMLTVIVIKYGFNRKNDNSIVKYRINSQIRTCNSIKYLVNDEEAKCIDGSKPAFYVRRNSKSEVSQWHIHFEGGGWCHDLPSCDQRAKDRLGSSSKYENCASFDSVGTYLSPKKNLNPLLYNFHLVYVRYCDGGSYAGYNDQQFKNKTLYFRGKSNRDATILALLTEHGMRQATEILISGCSAGGLGVLLGLDNMASMIKSFNSSIIVKGLVDSAYFMDHKGWKQNPEKGYDAVINGELDYSIGMKNVFHFMNISAGVPHKCLLHHKNNPAKCIFAENILPTIQTPLFAIQPLYDHWQLNHIQGNPQNITDVNKFGMNLFTQMTKILNSSTVGAGHAVFFDSCAHHCMGCSHQGVDLWNGKQIMTGNGINLAEAFSEWYQKRSTSTNYQPAVIYKQMGGYPCTNCCQCTV